VRDTVVFEREWFAAYARLVTLVGSDGTSPAAYQRTLEAAAAMGVTGLVDFEFSGGAADWAERFAEGADLLRIRMATYADGLDAVIEAGLRTGDVLPGCDERITMGPLKVISDGSLNTRTAWCCEPYADGTGLGAPNQTTEELHELLARAAAHHLEVATHAIGDAAVREALDVYAATGARGSIEHAQLIRRDDVRRLAELGIRASVQPAHLLDDRDATEKVWADRADRCFALRWMLDDGVTLAMGSECSSTPTRWRRPRTPPPRRTGSAGCRCTPPGSRVGWSTASPERADGPPRVGTGRRLVAQRSTGRSTRWMPWAICLLPLLRSSSLGIRRGFRSS
jgi:predicted amidohydrolase YtcJ